MLETPIIQKIFYNSRLSSPPVLRPVIPVKFPCFNRTKKDREILTYFQAAKKKAEALFLRCVCKLSPDLFVEFHFHSQRVED